MITQDFISLPNSKKNFISFTFDGVAIEEFGLVVVTNGDRLSLSLSENFKDTTSSISGVPGQLYWGTDINAQSYNFSLATDGMSEAQIARFRAHFTAGKVGKLILSEHPNRYAYARISEAIQGSFLPFERRVFKTINGKEVEFSTTEYRGEVSISFVVDSPEWYGKEEFLVLDEKNQEESFKIMYEDAVPLLGYTGIENNRIKQLCLGSAKAEISNGIVTTILSDTQTNLKKDEVIYLYNSGTKKTPVDIDFSFSVSLSQDGFISAPSNPFVVSGDSTNSFTISYFSNSKLLSSQQVKFVLPNYFYSYNRTISYIHAAGQNTSVVDLQNLIRDEIPHYIVRAWFATQLRILQTSDGNIDENGCLTLTGKTNLIRGMTKLLKDESGDCYGAKISIDSHNHSATMQSKFNAITATKGILYGQDFFENATEMIQSSYLYINGDYGLSDDGNIRYYSTISCSLPLTDVSVAYNSCYY